MGAWNGEPYGNDTAADWAWELDDADDWTLVEEALAAVTTTSGSIDEEDATIAIAAAEAVARGLGRPTQDDSYTESIAAFVGRAGEPPLELAELAASALAAATGERSGLTELWAESDALEWERANAALAQALAGN